MSREENRFGTGIPTFMGADYVTDVAATADYDIAFLGLPFEGGASFRKGQAEGPSVLRKYSDWDRLDGTEYVDLSRGGQVLRASEDRAVDLGDLRIDESGSEAMIAEIIRYVGRIASGCLPVFIGGDHSITYSTFQGARSRIGEDARVGILHFDAHFDVEKEYPKMPRVWHGNPFRELIKEEHIRPGDMHTVGVRSIVPKQWVDYAESQDLTYVTASQVHEQRAETLDMIKQRLSVYDAVYVTFDVDALDVTYCPGTGVPTSNGLTPGISSTSPVRPSSHRSLDLISLNIRPTTIQVDRAPSRSVRCSTIY